MQSFEENACLIHESSFHTNFFQNIRNIHSFFILSSVRPSGRPAGRPSFLPFIHPSFFPFVSFLPSVHPSVRPSIRPAFLPSFLPSFQSIWSNNLESINKRIGLRKISLLFREPKRPNPHIQITHHCKVKKPRKVLITGKNVAFEMTIELWLFKM